MPLILPHPITPTLTAASSLMVAPFSRSAFQHATPFGLRLSARSSLRLPLVSTLRPFKASLSAFQLSLPFGSCPVTSCETTFRQELCRTLRSNEPRHPVEKLTSCLQGSVLKG